MPVALEQLHILLIGVVPQRVRRGLEVQQAALRGRLLPLVAVAVTVKDHMAVILQLTLHERRKRGVKIRSRFQLVGELAQRFGHCGVQDEVGARDVEGRTGHTELKLVPCKGERRSTVAVGRVLGDGRQRRNANVHHGLFHIGIIDARAPKNPEWLPARRRQTWR